LERVESRGGHRRLDAPGLDSGLDGVHFIHAPDGSVRAERWA
jgi:hypothetical protein